MAGSALYYETAGSGEVLVLIHAGVADLRMWDAQVEAFKSHYRVIRFDAQGFGRSPAANPPVTRAEDLYQLLRQLGVARAHLVGVSMGGATAIDFAILHPQMVGALIPVAAGLSGSPRSDAWLEAQNRLEDQALERGDLETATRVDLQTWLAGPKRRLEDMDAALRERLAGMARAVLENDLERQPTPQIDPPAVGRLGEIQSPTLVIVGDADVEAVVNLADSIASGIRGARKLVLPDTAHMVNVERPAEFNRAVAGFLDAHPIAS